MSQSSKENLEAFYKKNFLDYKDAKNSNVICYNGHFDVSIPCLGKPEEWFYCTVIKKDHAKNTLVLIIRDEKKNNPLCDFLKEDIPYEAFNTDDVNFEFDGKKLSFFFGGMEIVIE